MGKRSTKKVRLNAAQPTVSLVTEITNASSPVAAVSGLNSSKSSKLAPLTQILSKGPNGVNCSNSSLTSPAASVMTVSPVKVSRPVVSSQLPKRQELVHRPETLTSTLPNVSHGTSQKEDNLFSSNVNKTDLLSQLMQLTNDDRVSLLHKMSIQNVCKKTLENESMDIFMNLQKGGDEISNDNTVLSDYEISKSLDLNENYKNELQNAPISTNNVIQDTVASCSDLSTDKNWLGIIEHNCNGRCDCGNSTLTDPKDRFYVKTSRLDFNEIMKQSHDILGKSWFTCSREEFFKYSTANLSKAVKNLSEVIVDFLVGSHIERPPFFDSTRLHELCASAATNFSDLNLLFDDLSQEDEELSNQPTLASLLYSRVYKRLDNAKEIWRAKNGIPTPTEQGKRKKRKSN